MLRETTRHKGQILGDSAHTRHLEDPKPQKQKVEWWIRGAEGTERRGMFTGCGVSDLKMKRILGMASGEY